MAHSASQGPVHLQTHSHHVADHHHVHRAVVWHGEHPPRRWPLTDRNIASTLNDGGGAICVVAILIVTAAYTALFADRGNDVEVNLWTATVAVNVLCIAVTTTQQIALTSLRAYSRNDNHALQFRDWDGPVEVDTELAMLPSFRAWRHIAVYVFYAGICLFCVALGYNLRANLSASIIMYVSAGVSCITVVDHVFMTYKLFLPVDPDRSVLSQVGMFICTVLCCGGACGMLEDPPEVERLKQRARNRSANAHHRDAADHLEGCCGGWYTCSVLA